MCTLLDMSNMKTRYMLQKKMNVVHDPRKNLWGHFTVVDKKIIAKHHFPGRDATKQWCCFISWMQRSWTCWHHAGWVRWSDSLCRLNPFGSVSTEPQRWSQQLTETELVSERAADRWKVRRFQRKSSGSTLSTWTCAEVRFKGQTKICLEFKDMCLISWCV